MRIVRRFCASLLLIIALAHRASAFALIGPYVPGMATNAMGSAMNIGQGYRWNVPIVTYAYDQSFLNFFGTNGVAAVDSAIQILNSLPPASTIDPTTYPTNAPSPFPPPGFFANGFLLDLKSTALGLVLREMGLAPPGQFIFRLQESVSGGVTNYNVIVRNFDPTTDAPSSNINDAPNSYALMTNNTTGQVTLLRSPESQGSITAVEYADVGTPGLYLQQLSYDDAGGLHYLLSTNNVALENLLPGVQGVGTNAGNYVTTALRPGVDKITFQRVLVDSLLGQLATPLTNQYVDSYISNGVLYHQDLQRVITQPDIIFSAASLDYNLNFTTSPASGWTDNGLSGQSGPGVIQPPINISFNRLGLRLRDFYDPTNGYTVATTPPWGSFDVSTNGGVTSFSNFVTYPVSSAPFTTFNLLFYPSSSSPVPFPLTGPYNQVSWNLPGSVGTPYVLQYSADLVNWTNITGITNNGSSITCMEQAAYAAQRFFRTIPQH